MKLSTRTSIEIPAPRELVFDLLVDADTLPQILRKTGPIPAVVESTMVGGATLQVGAVRAVKLSDGVEMNEEIVAFERPSEHGYRWQAGLRPPFAWLVRSGHGHWTFTAIDSGTRVEFRYAFELTSAWVYPLAQPVVWLFRRWMRRALERGRDVSLETFGSQSGRTSAGATTA